MIITILIAIVFTVLLAKAILETIYGLSLAVYAIIMMLVVAPTLHTMAFIVRAWYKVHRSFRKPKPRTAPESSGYIPGAIRFSAGKVS